MVFKCRFFISFIFFIYFDIKSAFTDLKKNFKWENLKMVFETVLKVRLKTNKIKS